jgi:hypothetical protein
LEEYENVQQWDQEEDRINSSIQELNQWKKTMIIIKRLKGTQEMKNLQIELKTMETKKQERQVELEPLQEKEAQMIAQLEDEKKIVPQEQTEGATLMQEKVTVQSVEALTGKAMQIREKGKELEETFHSLDMA